MSAPPARCAVGGGEAEVQGGGRLVAIPFAMAATNSGELRCSCGYHGMPGHRSSRGAGRRGSSGGHEHVRPLQRDQGREQRVHGEQSRYASVVIGNFWPSEYSRWVSWRIDDSCCCSSLGTTTMSSGGGGGSLRHRKGGQLDQRPALPARYAPSARASEQPDASTVQGEC